MVLSNSTSRKEVLRMKEQLPPLHVLFPVQSHPTSHEEPAAASDGTQNRGKRTVCDLLPFFSYGARVKLIDKIKVAIEPEQQNPAAEATQLGPAELHRLYAGTLVPQHRYLSTALNEAVNSPEIGPHPSKWLAGLSGIDLPKLVDRWLKTNRSTDYEQLYCIGLAPESGQLTAVLTVKRGSGYSGGPRTAGSKEHVAFWVDWGQGFHYEGTASVAVHDFGWLPPAGLEYNVSLPGDLLGRARANCRDGKTVKVRAVLSWDTPPSTTDPNAPVIWGDVMECRVLIPARQEKTNEKRWITTARDAEDEEVYSDGRIVDAAIKALAGMSFGAKAGMTVAPSGTLTRAGMTDRSFTIKAEEIEDGGMTFSLHVWNHGCAMPEQAAAGFCQQGKG